MSEPIIPPGRTVSRRTVLRTLTTGAGAVALLPLLSDEGLLAFTELQRTNAARAPKIIPAARFATLERLVEAIIPSDTRSPGAKQARVADYIDILLTEADDIVKQAWLDGLEALDAEAKKLFGASVARIDAASLDTLMSNISRHELEPITPLEFFFKTVKRATIHGYYTSEIGIHKELRYKGNQMLPVFVGCATEDGKDCPHCKQKAAR